MKTNENGIRQEIVKSEITLDKLSTSAFQKEGTKTAQLRQVVTTTSTYPAMKVNSDMQDNMFALEEFDGISEGKSFESTDTRIAFLDVPAKSTEETIKARLSELNKAGACIYKTLSNHPILDNNQELAIKNGITTKDIIANAQVVRFSDNDAEGRGGKLSLDKNGKIQYRNTYFSLSPKEDMDLRTSEVLNVYTTEEIEMELKGASVLSSQTV